MTITTTKDAYLGQSCRVNYWDPSAVRTERRMRNLSAILADNPGELPTPEDMFEEVEVTYENLLFCERLHWTTDEAELDARIEAKRAELESLSITPPLPPAP
jgi:hypothetical protein